MIRLIHSVGPIFTRDLLCCFGNDGGKLRSIAYMEIILWCGIGLIRYELIHL